MCIIEPMSRMKVLRVRKGWNQPTMAAFLGVHQSQVSRIETGKLRESGPVSRLLDRLEAEIAAELCGRDGVGASDDDAPSTQPKELSAGARRASSSTVSCS